MQKLAITFSLSALLLCTATLCAQVPDTDIFLFDIDLVGGRVNYRNVVRVTDREGYDNQPAFTPDGRFLLFSSIRDGEQSDIYRYNITSGETERLTFTPESEYSPIPIPGSKRYSVVRVNLDSSQVLWKYGPKPRAKAAPVLSSVKDLGYYTWMDKENVALWRLGEPPTLELMRLSERFPSQIAEDIGRTLTMLPYEWTLAFVDKSKPEGWMIRTYGMITKKFNDIVAPLPEMEDFCWSPEGYLLMGKEGKLYTYFPGKDSEWHFNGGLGIGNFYRMTFSPDGKKLAVVTMTE